MEHPFDQKVSFRVFSQFHFLWLIFLYFLVFQPHVFSQNTLFYDDFEYGDLNQNPAWAGDTDEFVIINDNGNHLLRLDGDEAGGISQLVTESGAAHGTWEFFVRLDHFAPSNNNRAFIFLMADRSDLTGEVNGYALRTGENGQPKHFRIVRFDNGSQTTVLSSTSELVAGDYRVKITRDETGTWNLYSSEGFLSDPVIDSGPVVDNAHTTSTHFGIRVHYTATRRDRFFFDEFRIRDFFDPIRAVEVQVNNSREIDIIFTDRIDEISLNSARFEINENISPESAALVSSNMVRLGFETALADGAYELSVAHVRDERGHFIDENTQMEFKVSNPFGIQNVIAPSADSINVHFTEAVAASSLTITNFTVENYGPPAVLDFQDDDESIVRLSFHEPFASGQYNLIAAGISSQSGWDLPENSIRPFFIFDEIAPGDVVINEFMYLPPGSMPMYVELNNTTGKLLNVRDWQLKDNTGTERMITTEPLPLEPGGYLVLSPDTLGLKAIFGGFNFYEMNNFPSLNRTAGDQIRLFDHSGAIMDSLYYIPAIWGGDGAALERRSPAARTGSPYNWTESTHILGGTPGSANTAVPAPDPPYLTEAYNLGSDTLMLIFDREVTTESAEKTSSYIIDNHPGAVSANRTGLEAVQLILASSLMRGTEYSIAIKGIESIFGITGEQTKPFYFVEPVEPGEVFINEFMYRPPDGYTRYIEIFNPGDKAVDLAGWTTNNNTGNLNFITRSRTVLPPDSYIILAPDESLLAGFPDIHLMDMASRFQALKLNGDDIVLKNADGLLLDSLTYEPGWGGNGISLERKSIELPAYFRDNWGDSPAGLVGTPGTTNFLLPDTAAPLVEFVSAATDRRLTILFSKSPDYQSAQTTGHYSIYPEIKIESAELNEIRVFLNLASPLEAEKEYELRITNIEDIFGNRMEDKTLSFTWLPFRPPEERDVVINEFLYRPLTDGVQRFLELYNRSENNFDLNQWQIGRGTGSPLTLHGSTLADGSVSPIPLLPGQYIVITGNSGSLPEAGNVIEVPGFPAFSRFGDAVYIRDSDGIRIDSLYYQPDWGANADGFSLQRINPGGASNDPFNWTGSPEISAGARNQKFSDDSIPPKILYATLTEDNDILVRLNKFIINDPQTVFLLKEEPLSVINYDPFGANTLLFEFGREINDQNDVYFRAGKLVDFSGNVKESFSLPLSRPMEHGDVVINEIMYRPRSDRYSDLPDQSEFVELYNRRDYAVSLEGFFIHDRPDRDNLVSKREPVSSLAGWIPARRYAVIFADPEPDFKNTRISASFDLENGDRFFRVGQNTLGLSATGDEVYLANFKGLVIDSVFYRDDWHNPNLIDSRGISLERINPDVSGNDSRNWTSSTHARGGSPGEQNTVFAFTVTDLHGEGLLIDPNPFSPDGDGFEDHLFINYSLNEPDFLMRIRIFDRHGRLVKTLADGEVAGLSGQVIWDGRKDDQTENRVGIYIILFEAYNSSTGANRTFRKTVVLARQL